MPPWWYRATDKLSEVSGELHTAAAARGTTVEEMRRVRGALERFGRFDGALELCVGDMTPLLLAVQAANVAVARELLAWGANANPATRSGYSPLAAAVKTGSLAAVQMLLQAGAAVPATLLATAASRGHSGILRLLLATLPSPLPALPPHATDGTTALHAAAQFGHVHCAVALIAALPSSVHAAAADGATPLHAAARHGCVPVVRLLLLHGARVDAQDGSGHTPLNLAAALGHADAVTALVTFRPPTPVDCDAAPCSSVLQAEEAAACCAGGSGSGSATRGGTLTSLCIAAFYKRVPMLRQLVALGASVDARAGDHLLTALHCAAQRGDMATVEALLALHADPAARDGSGCTPLHHAAAGGHAAVMRRLAASPSRGAAAATPASDDGLLHATDDAGQTALDHAATGCHVAVCLEVLSGCLPGRSSRAPAFVMDEHVIVRTALRLVSTGNVPAAAAFFAAVPACIAPRVLRAACAVPSGPAIPTLAGLDVDACHPLRQQRWSPLLVATASNNAHAIQQLAALGVDLVAQPGPVSAMHLAAARGHVEAIAALVALGAAVNVPDSQGAPPILLAHRGGFPAAVACLAAALVRQVGGAEAAAALG